jgi:ectoine hydroxylase-related dioxygenase (phytanoyl-CoA dioxygenase family)
VNGASAGGSPSLEFELYPSPEEVAFFRENGYLVVERLTTNEELEWLEEVLEDVVAKREALGGDGATLEQYAFPEIAAPDLLRTAYRRNARSFVAALLAVPEKELSSWGHLVRKPAEHGHEVPWHQDEAYWDPRREYRATAAWLPLHEVTVERGCMHFIPGSHHGEELVNHAHIEAGSRLSLLQATGVDRSRAVACPLLAGGATFHHQRTLHYSGPNTTGKPRLAYPLEFQTPPRRRSTPARWPWVSAKDSARVVAPDVYVADGEVVPFPD